MQTDIHSSPARDLNRYEDPSRQPQRPRGGEMERAEHKEIDMLSFGISTDTLNLPDAPAIPGLAFRRFLGASDYPAMADVIQRSREADRIEDASTAEDLARVYGHLTRCDPYRDVLMAEIEGRLIGYNRVTWEQEEQGDRLYVHIGYLVPEWRERGIGRAMLRHSERRLRHIAAGHNAQGPCFFSTWARDSQTGLVSLLDSEGYDPVRRFYEMTRDLDDLPEAPMPDVLEVRTVGPDQVRAVWDANVEAFRDHWGFVEPQDESYQRWLKGPNFDPGLWQVAWDGDEIAGMVLNFIDERENAKYNRKRGYTEDICVRRPWRRRGLARALIVRSFHVLRTQGMTEAALGVDTENLCGALRLYESVGFRPVKRSAAYRKALT